MNESKNLLINISPFPKNIIQNQNQIYKTKKYQILNNNFSNYPLINYGIINPIINFYYLNLLYKNLFFFSLKKEKIEESENKNIKNKNEEVENDNNILLGKKKKRTIRLCTECPHKMSQHYAKGMCSNCYHSKGRIKKPWKCPHINKTHYALGVCQNCYQMNYIKKQSMIDNKKFIFKKFECFVQRK